MLSTLLASKSKNTAILVGVAVFFANFRLCDRIIQCIHLHDNTGVDAHQMPLTGDTDWRAVMAAFKEIGYSGVTSIEYSHGTIPEELADAYIRLTYRAAGYLWTL